MVAVLCASRTSIYHSLGVDVYDDTRDAMTFPGDQPVIAHPPCRAWSAFCAHQAKPEPGEKDLGLWCCEQLKQCGGVLEHPAHSRMFAAAGLPLPGERCGGLWSMAVDQSWWGDSRKKGTWLCFSRVAKENIEVPFILRDSSGDRRRWQVMSKRQRAETCIQFAEWLISVANSTI